VEYLALKPGSRGILYNCTATNNVGSKGGVAMAQTDSSIIAINSYLSNNYGSLGGAFHLVYGAKLELTGTTVSKNTATRFGGAIYCSDSKVNLVSSLVQDNVVTPPTAENPNANFFCATIPSYTHCTVKSANDTWDNFCPIPEYDQPSNNYGVDKFQLSIIIAIPTVGLLLCIACLVGGVICVRKRKDGYVPMWARKLTGTMEKNEFSFEAEEMNDQDDLGTLIRDAEKK